MVSPFSSSASWHNQGVVWCSLGAQSPLPAGLLRRNLGWAGLGCTAVWSVVARRSLHCSASLHCAITAGHNSNQEISFGIVIQALDTRSTLTKCVVCCLLPAASCLLSAVCGQEVPPPRLPPPHCTIGPASSPQTGLTQVLTTGLAGFTAIQTCFTRAATRLQRCSLVTGRSHVLPVCERGPVQHCPAGVRGQYPVSVISAAALLCLFIKSRCNSLVDSHLAPTLHTSSSKKHQDSALSSKQSLQYCTASSLYTTVKQTNQQRKTVNKKTLKQIKKHKFINVYSNRLVFYLLKAFSPVQTLQRVHRPAGCGCCPRRS